MNPLEDCVQIRRHSRRAKKETLHIFKSLVICAVSGEQENLPFSQEQGLFSPQAGPLLASLPRCGRRGLPRCLVSLMPGPGRCQVLGPWTEEEDGETGRARREAEPDSGRARSFRYVHGRLLRVVFIQHGNGLGEVPCRPDTGTPQCSEESPIEKESKHQRLFFFWPQQSQTGATGAVSKLVGGAWLIGGGRARGARAGPGTLAWRRTVGKTGVS